ncbi:MAG: sulfite exporter TauE/SafE family protein [Leucobacter sp.]|nr:sulfite exporter TauE/SafE family protein [Leucobacter sp.]
MTSALRRRPNFIALVGVGLAAGMLSGLFGIGGGTIIVPALVLWLHMPQRLAAGTSVAAILPAAVVGAISYGAQGNVDWVAALCLALGIVIGAQLGTFLLSRLPVKALQWGFVVFLLIIIVSLWFVVPQREDQISITWLTGLFLVLTGFMTGVLSGVLGVGGGIIVVPVLMFFFGSNDLDAKGSSLVMMIPGSISGTLGNLRRQNVDMRAALIVGISASVCVPFSSVLATLLDPFVANVLFSFYLVIIAIQMVVRLSRRKK